MSHKPNYVYILRNIPPELWRRAKHRAVDDGISLRELLLRALEMLVAQKEKGK